MLGGLDQCGVDGRLPVVLRVGAPLIKSLDSQEERAHTDRGKDERGQRAGELEGPGSRDPPGDDDAHALAHGHLVGDVDGVGDQGDRHLRIGQRRQERDLASHLGGRGAPVETDGVTRVHQSGCCLGDTGLLIGHLGGAITQRRLGGGGVGDGAATGALISCWSARWSRSRRAVAAETPNRVMMSSIWTLPSSMTMSRMAEWRSCRDISILLRLEGVVRTERGRAGKERICDLFINYLPYPSDRAAGSRRTDVSIVQWCSYLPPESDTWRYKPCYCRRHQSRHCVGWWSRGLAAPPPRTEKTWDLPLTLPSASTARRASSP